MSTPEAANETALNEIIDSFSFFDDWEDKYRFIIDLGKSLPELPDEARQEDNIVRGCQSQVWLLATLNPDDGLVHLQIDSDAHIVRGLIAIVLAALDRKSPGDILQFNIEELFEELQLLKHLSPTRGNGLRAMIARIREFAVSAG